tara:strand:+ start:12561 stop:13400 length:840 start_codon:yes stop_codon:yes gene_type:complete
MKNLEKFISESLEEDIKNGDITSLSCIEQSKSTSAELISKDEGVIAGVELAKQIFEFNSTNLLFTRFVSDGEKIKNGQKLLSVSGNAREILAKERFVLNSMQRMSGIATKTKKFQNLINHTDCKILDTRKTTPLNRIIEKWAVRIGGGTNHRFGLYDEIMIKDNHIDFNDDIQTTVKKTIHYLNKNNLNYNIIVEVRSIDELKKILQFKEINRIVLDNFNIDHTNKAVDICRNIFKIESSGNIDFDNIVEYAECGVDFISCGSLTHSVECFDMSLLILK